MRVKNKTTIFFIVIFSIFFIVKGCCLIYTGDDIWWGHIPSFSVYLDKYIENGRFFTNLLSIYSCRSVVFRDILYAVSLISFSIMTAWLIGRDLKLSWVHYFFVVFIMLFANFNLYQNVFNWTSGFVNYIISLLFFFIFIYSVLPIFDGQAPESSILRSAVFLVIGFLGALCVEHITIYSLLFGIFVLIYSIIKYKKVSAFYVTYLLGAVLGALLMFSVSNYTEIASSGDSCGFRSFEFEISDILVKIFLEIIPWYARKFFFLHAVIILSLIVLSYKKYGSVSKKPKYFFICLCIVVSFGAYSFISEFIHPFALTSLSYKSRAVETAFTFCYLVSLIYLIYILMSGGSRFKAIFYLVSTVIVTVPFCVVSPITPRCFFADYIFWCIFAFRLACEAIKALDLKENKIFNFAASVISCAGLGIILFMDISNKYVDIIRLDHIREELDSGQKYIEFINLPYNRLVFDSASLTNDNGDSTENKLSLSEEKGCFISYDGKDYSYTEAYYHFYNIDPSVLDKIRIDINIMDYNTSNGK